MTTHRPLKPLHGWMILALIWLGICAVLLANNWAFLLPMNFRDPDDALRLVQVRDLLAGQSWFDLTQHRIFPPQGVPMHWSRLVDLPLALMLAALKPLLGAPLAERVLLVIFPAFSLLMLMVLVRALCRRLDLSPIASLVSIALLATSLSILVQFAPMRIDHHGAQILCGLLAMLALVRAGQRNGSMGFWAGVAMASWLQISLEGLPCAIAMGGVYGLRHMLRSDGWRDMRNYLLALTGISAALLFGTHFPTDALIPWCDSLSPAYLVPLGLCCLTLVASGAMTMPRGGDATPLRRVIPLILGGAVGAATFLAMSRQCLAGPFETLDPIVYQNWFVAVKEGMPINTQTPDLQAIIVLPALLGLLGGLIGWRQARTAELRQGWTGLLFMQLVAFAVSLNLMRAMSFAHLLALPGNVVLLMTLMSAAQRLRLMPLRVILSTATVCLTPFGAAAAMAAALNSADNSASDGVDRYRCTTYSALRGLDSLPPALLFTPLDVGSHILVYTHHQVVATGHHRNALGMKIAVSGLMARPDMARRIITDSGARYLAFCSGENEIVKYARRRPDSLIAMLLHNQRPDWLVPVPMRPGERIRVFRIADRGADQPATNLSATPFMQ